MFYTENPLTHHIATEEPAYIKAIYITAILEPCSRQKMFFKV